MLPVYPSVINHANLRKYINDSCVYLKKKPFVIDIDQIYKQINSVMMSNCQYLPLICECIKVSEFIPLTSNLLAELENVGYFEDDSNWTITAYLLGFVANLTDKDYDIANLIRDTDISTMVVDIVTHAPYRKQIKIDMVCELMLSSLTIILNITRWPGNQSRFKTDEMKNALVEIIRLNDSNEMGINSILILSFLVDETEHELLETGKSTIKALLHRIQKCKDDGQAAAKVVTEPVVMATVSKEARSTLAPKVTNSFRSWKTADIQSWLSGADLGHLGPQFSGYNGDLIWSLMDLRHRSPDSFYTMLQTDFKLSSKDLLRFNSALAQLE